ncbi:ABC transporter substrate-binding protein [Aporhodopirellula aestuarii]|uniref:ABC transporter substrate-binding protein n=1 Tax=Aporhodopirellula aestuarii TaxID=2950107 RepID=A0ABT0U5N4_9BACT|nr:ABC transporter substrate-binding protein [Aporhodopirellula aestuarii]MCM2372156.1 ABC transporter substrate-binding protein [Aporhodopirellula aestuarii]
MRFPDRSGERPHRSPTPSDLPRREWLAGAISVISLAGCRSETQTTDSSASPRRTDVPLRIVWVGDESETEILRRTWGSISEQPLDIRLVDAPRPKPDADSAADAKLNLGRELFDKAGAADVIIYPVAMMSELVAEKRLMPLLTRSEAAKKQTVDQTDDDAAALLANSDTSPIPVALRIATSFSGERLATPLGGYLPALVLGEESQNIALDDWDAYEAFVKSSGGACCEPTAPTWAGSMYLWRLASSLTATWLFERESLQPLFSEPEYVAVLEQMRRTVKQSADASKGRTPGEIYNAVMRGELLGGIGFPQPNHARATAESANDGGGTVTLASLPAGSSSKRLEQTQLGLRLDPSRGMVDPFMLVGSLAASCRQTAAADTFLNWISGGQGSEPLYRGISSIVDTRTAPSESTNNPLENYRGWLNTQLSNASFVTTLQLIGAAEYYDVLDEVVRSCVHGDQSAQDACAELTDRWARLHRKYDLPTQKRTWRRAQGLS